MSRLASVVRQYCPIGQYQCVRCVCQTAAGQIRIRGQIQRGCGGAMRIAPGASGQVHDVGHGISFGQKAWYGRGVGRS